jgi:3-hydroxyacyl-[acyl-carrier-protein] dehydratase
MDSLDIDGILKILPHRFPFVMIDRVLELEPGVRAIGRKCVSVNEPFFQGHFPDMPILPGVLLAESFAQLAGIVAFTANPDRDADKVLLLGLDKLRFRKPVRPGDVVEVHCEKEFEKRDIWRFKCVAYVDGQKAATGSVTATVTDRE